MSTTKSEYTQLCTEILDAVGGSKNIKNVFHCITRLRIVPVNRDAVDMDKLSKVSGILKVVESSGRSSASSALPCRKCTKSFLQCPVWLPAVLWRQSLPQMMCRRKSPTSSPGV